MPPPLSSITKGIIWNKVQPRERPYTSHLVFLWYSFLSPPRKHAPLFLFHNMFTRVECLITATSSSLYLNHIPFSLLVHNDAALQGCVLHMHIFSRLSHIMYLHIELLWTKVAGNKGKLKYCFCGCSFFSQIRDDNKRQHPCLVDFSKLPETEKNYNLQMSTETLKYVEHYGLIFPTVLLLLKRRRRRGRAWDEE